MDDSKFIIYQSIAFIDFFLYWDTDDKKLEIGTDAFIGLKHTIKILEQSVYLFRRNKGTKLDVQSDQPILVIQVS